MTLELLARPTEDEPVVAEILRSAEAERAEGDAVAREIHVILKQLAQPTTLEEIVQAAWAAGMRDVPEAVLCSMVFDFVDRGLLVEDNLGRVLPRPAPE